VSLRADGPLFPWHRAVVVPVPSRFPWLRFAMLGSWSPIKNITLTFAAKGVRHGAFILLSDFSLPRKAMTQSELDILSVRTRCCCSAVDGFGFGCCSMCPDFAALLVVCVRGGSRMCPVL
jgi:hypothetical protein